MTFDLSVAIPTYNGADRLPKLLEKLRSQFNTDSFSWEIIIIDNNSTDSTAALIQAIQQNWNFPYPLRYCFEAEQGLAFARNRGITEAQGELVAFLDDDNHPDPDWVAQAYQFAQNHPQAGAFGGQIHGEFAISPPANFKRIESFLAIRERGSEPHLYQPQNLSLPPGAALVVRRQVWLDNVPKRLHLVGRIQGSMLAGEDYEALLYIHRAGWEIWYNPAMHTYHQIPPHRLEKSYLVSLIRGSSLCLCYLRMLNAKHWQKPLIFLRMILGSSKRILQHWLKSCRYPQTDLVATCEWEFLQSSLLSPFYYMLNLFPKKAEPERDISSKSA
ncbi:MAG: hormogonium polysaccharide biosynthesis glycosyltransferase HpsE [Desertifilum sp.]|nr:hormogonium polysaccharide biosynthesis glycosyltransferase HpsE [Desertifilum sp.]